MSSGWPTVELGTLLTNIQPGFASGRHNSEGRGLPHFRPMNVSTDGQIERSVLKFVAADAGRPDVRLRRGDVLFNNTNSPELVGKTALFEDDDSPAFSNHMTRLRVDQSRLDARYAALRLHQAWREGWFAAHCNNHVSQASIGRDMLQSFEIELPPLDVQRAIASLGASVDASRLSAAGHLVSARRAVERFRQAVLAAACSGRLTADWRETHSVATSGAELVSEARHRREAQQGRRFKEPDLNEHSTPGEQPDTWSISPLGLLLSEIKYGTSVRSDYGGKGIGVLRIPNVSSGRLDLTDLKYGQLSDREAQDLRLTVGDVLMIRSNGSPQLVGRSVLVDAPEAVGMAYAGYLMRLRVDPEAIIPGFLALAMASPDVRHQVEMPLRSTSGVNNINTEEVRRLAIPVPPLDEQSEITRRVGHLLEFADMVTLRVGAASKRLDLTAQAVLAKAFRGELSLGAV